MNTIIATLLLHGMVQATGALRVVNSKQSRDASVCVLSRVIQPELPYIESWIKHHESLGAQTFYLLTNHPDEHNTISGFLGGASADVGRISVSGSWFIRRRFKTVGSKATIQLYTLEGGGNSFMTRDATAKILSEITEDFVVGIDIDEYWVMPQGVSTFVDLIAADHNEADIHYATWQMTMNDGFDVPVPPYQVWQGGEHKWIARTNAIEKFDCHNPTLRRNSTGGSRHDQGELLHFWGRSFQDQLLKGIAQTGMTKGGEGPARTIQLLNSGLLPQRLKLLAFLATHRGQKQMSFDTPVLTRKGNLENQYISVAFNTTMEQTQQILNKARQTYLTFKACLARHMDLPIYPGGLALNQIAKFLDNICTRGARGDAQLDVSDGDFNRILASIDDLE